MRSLGIAVVALLAWGVLAFGAVYPWAYWPLAAGSAVVGLWGLSATGGLRDRRVRAFAIAATSLILVMLLQCIGWPVAVVDAVAPSVAEFRSAFEVGYRPGDRESLSIDPRSTVEALLYSASLAVLLAGLLRGLRLIPLTWLMNQIWGLAVGLAVVAVVQKVLLDPKAPLLYGFWRPEQGGNPFGPFVNRNHFAGWVLMVLPLAVAGACHALQVARHPNTRRLADRFRWMTSADGTRVALLGFVSVTLFMAIALTGSRSGVAGAIVALLALTAAISKDVANRAVRRAAVIFVLLAIVGGVSWAGLNATVARFAVAGGDAEGRLAAWRDTRRIIADFPVFGIGFGTYHRAMLAYQTSGRTEIYAQAHNDYLQFLAEGGLVGAGAAAAIGLVLMATMRRRFRGHDDDPFRRWMRWGAVAGLTGIAAQSLVEFSLQMPGVAVLTVVLLAIACHRPPRRHHPREGAGASRV
jgi:O-antigen ligase